MTAANLATAMHTSYGSPLNKLVMIFLAEWSSMDGQVRLNRDKLSEFTEASLDEVEAALEDLRKRGWLNFGPGVMLEVLPR